MNEIRLNDTCVIRQNKYGYVVVDRLKGALADGAWHQNKLEVFPSPDAAKEAWIATLPKK
jgi:hypothetical protein